MSTLSLCMIVKNEAAHLDRCLDSVRPLVDEIVIADTGSTDGTLEIARHRADRVVSFPWCDDFSAARNFVLGHAHGDWILSLDADETIATRDHARIRVVLECPPLDAVESIHRHYLVDGTVVGWKPGSGGYEEGTPYQGYFDVPCRRLFRRIDSLRWQNPVHEEVISIDPARPMHAEADDWVVHHFGKAGTPALLAAKAEMYLRIGVRKATQAPDDVLAQYELGIQLQELQRWEEALTAMRRVAEIAPGFRQSDLYAAISLTKLMRFEEALEALARARRSTPASKAEILLEEGNIYLAQKQAEKASHAYRAALRIEPALAAASFNLAILALEKRDHAQMRQWLDRTVKHAPFNVDARLLRAALLREQGDEAAAVKELNVVPNDPRVARLLARIYLEHQDIDAAAAALAAAPSDVTTARRALDGALALTRGDAAGARQALEAAWPGEATVETALNLSAARLGTGDREGARMAIGEALRLEPDHATARERHRALSPFEAGPSGPVGDRPLRIFFWHPHSLSYDARTPRTKGLGGTESAIVYLAEALAARGHHVAIFNSCPEPGTQEGVEYAPWQTLPLEAARRHPDVVIAVRHWSSIKACRFAPLQMFWTGDAYDQPYLEGIAADQSTGAIDLVVLQSRWQIDTIRHAHGVPPWRIVQTRLGYAPRAGQATGSAAHSAPRAQRLAYASTPFRGLDVLLDLFPAIRERCPDAELKVFSSMKVYGMSDADDRAQFDDIYRRANQPGVELVGTLPQPRLAEALSTCRVLAYPNHWPETFCIAAIEAEAAGCPVLSSMVGALPETIGDGGLCLHGDPRSPAYQHAFVNAAVELLTDDRRWRALSQRALDRTLSHFSWAAIAHDWERRIVGALENESPEVDRVARHLASGRAALASRMMDKMSCPAGVDPAAWQQLSALTGVLAADGDVPAALVADVVCSFGAVRRTGAIERALSRRDATMRPEAL